MTTYNGNNNQNGPMGTVQGVGNTVEDAPLSDQERGTDSLLASDTVEINPDAEEILGGFGEPPVNFENSTATHYVHYDLSDSEAVENSIFKPGVGFVNSLVCTELYSDLPYRDDVEVIASLGHKTLVVVENERVGIGGLYHFVSVVDTNDQNNGKTGYVHIDFCRKLPGVKPSLLMNFDCREDRFVIEDVCNITTPKWHETKEPYLDRQTCDYIINFTTEHLDTGDDELPARMQQAIAPAVVEMLDYYDKQYDQASLNEILNNSFQFAEATSWYLNPNREESRLQVLVVVPAKYMDAIPTTNVDLENFDISSGTQVATTIDMDTFQGHIDVLIELMLGFHENRRWQKVKSLYSGPAPSYGEYDFTQEAKKVRSFAAGLRSFVEVNGFLVRDDLGDTLEIGFSGVEEDDWRITYIILNNSSGSHVLRVGFGRLLQKHPFNDTRTLNYIFNLFEIASQISKYKELPGGFKEFFDSYVLPPLDIDASSSGSRSASTGASGGTSSKCKPTQGNPLKCLSKNLRELMDSHLDHVGDRFKCESVPSSRRFSLFQESDSVYDSMESGKLDDFKNKFAAYKIPEAIEEERDDLIKFGGKTKIEGFSAGAVDFVGDPFLEEFIASFQDFNKPSSQTARILGNNQKATSLNKKVSELNLDVIDKFAFLTEIATLLNEEDPSTRVQRIDQKQREITMQVAANRLRRQAILKAIKTRFSGFTSTTLGSSGEDPGDKTILTVTPQAAREPTPDMRESESEQRAQDRAIRQLAEEDRIAEDLRQKREIFRQISGFDTILKAASKKKRRVRKTRSASRIDLLAAGLDGAAQAEMSENTQRANARENERLTSRIAQLRSNALRPYTIVLQEEPTDANIENLLFGNPESAMRAGGQAVFKKFLLEVSRGFDLGTALKRVINCLCTEISQAQDRARRIEDPVDRNAALASLESLSLAVGCENICGAVPLLCSCLGFPAFPPKFNLPDSLSIKFGDIMYGIGVLITNTIITQIMQIVIQFIITMLNKLTSCDRTSDSQKLFIDRFRLMEQEGMGGLSADDINNAFEDNGLPLGFSSEEDITNINSLAKETVLILTPREFCDLINGNANIETIELVEALMVESYPKLRSVFSNVEKVKLLYLTIGQLIGPSLCRSLVDLFDIMPFEPSNYICDETNLREDLLQGRATSEQIQEQVINALKCDSDKVISVINLIKSFSEGDNVADKIMPPIMQTPDNPNGIIPREPESVKHISTKARTTLLQSVRDSFYSEANQNVSLLVTSKGGVDLGASAQDTADAFSNSFFSGGRTSSPLGALVSMMQDSGKLTNSANNAVMQSVISNMYNGPFAGDKSMTGRSIADQLKLKLQNTDDTIISFPRTSEETSFLGSDLISIELPISKIAYDPRGPIAGSFDNYMTPFATPQWDRIPHFEEHPRIAYNLCISATDSLDINHIRDVYSIELEDLKFPANNRTIFSFDGEKRLPSSVINTIESSAVDLGLHPGVSRLLSTPQIVFSEYVMDSWAKIESSLLSGPVSEKPRGNHFVRYHSDILFKTTSEDVLKGLARRLANSRFLKGDFQQNYDELSSVEFVLNPECSLDSFGLLGIADVHDKISRLYDEDPDMDYAQRYVNAMSLGIAIIFVRVVIVEIMLNSVFVFSEFKATDIFKSDMIVNYAMNIIKDELQSADSKYAHSSKDGTFFKHVVGRIASDIRRRKINKEQFVNPITGEQVSVLLPLNGFVDAPGSPGSLLDVGFFNSGNQDYNRQQSVRKCRQSNFTQAENNEDDCVPLSQEVSGNERSDGSVDPNLGTTRLGFMEFFIMEQLHQLGEKIEGILGAPTLDIDDIILGEYAKEIHVPEYPGALRFTKPISAFVRLSADNLNPEASGVYERISDDEFIPSDNQETSLSPLKDVAFDLLQQKIDELKQMPFSEKFKDKFLYLADGGFVLEKYIKIEDFTSEEWDSLYDSLGLDNEQISVINTKILQRSDHLRGIVNVNVWTDWFNQLLLEEASALSFVYEVDDNGASVINFAKLFKSWSFGSRLVMVYPFENLTSQTPIPYLANLERARNQFIEDLDLSEASQVEKAYKMSEISNIDVDLLPTDLATSDPIQAGINLQNLLFSGDEEYASLARQASQTFRYNTLPIVTKEVTITKENLNMVPIFGSVDEILQDLKSSLNSIFLSNIRARYNELRIQFNNILFPSLNLGDPGLPYPVNEDGTRNISTAESDVRIVDGTLYVSREKTAVADASFPWNGARFPEQVVDVNYDGANLWYSGYTVGAAKLEGALGTEFDAIAFTEGYPHSRALETPFTVPSFPAPGYWQETDPVTNNRMAPLNVGRAGVPQQGDVSSVVQFKEMIAASGLDPEGGDSKLAAAFDRISKVEGWRDSEDELRANSAAGSLLFISKYLLGFSPIHSYWGKRSGEFQVLESIDKNDSWIWGYPRSFLGITDSSVRTLNSIEGRGRGRREVETQQVVNLDRDTIGGRLDNIDWEIPEQAIATFRVPEDPLTGEHPLFREWYIGGPDATGNDLADGKIWQLLVDKFNPDYFPNDADRQMSSAIVEHSQNGVSALEYNYLIFAEKMGSFSRGLFDVERGIKYVYDSLVTIEARIEEMQEIVSDANAETIESLPPEARVDFIQILNDLELLYDQQMQAADRSGVNPIDRCFVGGEFSERKGTNECYRYDVLYDNMLKVRYYKNIVEGNATSQLDNFNNIFDRVFRDNLHSQIKADDGYQTMFQYIFPASRFLSMLTIYNNEYVSRLPGRKQMFDQTKRILFNLNFDLASLLEEKWWQREPQRMPDWWQSGLQIGPPLVYILSPFIILEALISIVPPLKWLLGMFDTPGLIGGFLNIDVSSWVKFPSRDSSGDPCEAPNSTAGTPGGSADEDGL